MRSILIVNWLLFGLTGFIALCIAVVMFIYLFYLGDEPTMRDDWPTLQAALGLFTAVAAVSGGCVYAWHQNSRWRWPLQLLLVLGFVALALFADSMR